MGHPASADSEFQQIFPSARKLHPINTFTKGDILMRMWNFSLWHLVAKLSLLLLVLYYIFLNTNFCIYDSAEQFQK